MDYLVKDIDLCCFDFSSSGKSQGTINTFGLKQYKDIRAVIKKLKSKKYGYEKFILWGRSMGAVASFLLVASTQQVDKQIQRDVIFQVLDSPFNKFQTICYHQGKQSIKLPQAFIQYGLTILKDHFKDHPQQKNPFNINLLSIAQNCSTQTLFVFSQTDNIIPSQNSLQLIKNLPKGTYYQKLIIKQNHNSLRKPQTNSQIILIIHKNYLKWKYNNSRFVNEQSFKRLPYLESDVGGGNNQTSMNIKNKKSFNQDNKSSSSSNKKCLYIASMFCNSQKKYSNICSNEEVYETGKKMKESQKFQTGTGEFRSNQSEQTMGENLSNSNSKYNQFMGFNFNKRFKNQRVEVSPDNIANYFSLDKKNQGLSGNYNNKISSLIEQPNKNQKQQLTIFHSLRNNTKQSTIFQSSKNTSQPQTPQLYPTMDKKMINIKLITKKKPSFQLLQQQNTQFNPLKQSNRNTIINQENVLQNHYKIIQNNQKMLKNKFQKYFSSKEKDYYSNSNSMINMNVNYWDNKKQGGQFMENGKRIESQRVLLASSFKNKREGNDNSNNKISQISISGHIYDKDSNDTKKISLLMSTNANPLRSSTKEPSSSTMPLKKQAKNLTLIINKQNQQVNSNNKSPYNYNYNYNQANVNNIKKRALYCSLGKNSLLKEKDFSIYKKKNTLDSVNVEEILNQE